MPYGIDAETPNNHPRPSPDKSFQIVFVSSFHRWHGVEALVAALALAQPRMPNLRLNIIGDGISRPACEQKARELGVDGIVQFPGRLPWEKQAQRVRTADLAVAPYLRVEPFDFDPVKLLE